MKLGIVLCSIFTTVFLISSPSVEAKPKALVNFDSELPVHKDDIESTENFKNHQNIAPVHKDIINPIDIDTEKQGKAAEHYDAFISYRRAPSRNLAMLLKVMLERENVSAFLDVEDLSGGHWDQQLVDGILESPNFILILSNGTLDRLRNDFNYTDFMHKEIKEAVDADRRIILVFDDFNFPTDMSEYSPEVVTALDNQGLTWEHSLVDQCLERLMSYMMQPTPLSSNHQIHLPSRNH